MKRLGIQLVVAAALVCAAAVWAGSQKLSLQVREGQLRSRPTFLGSVVTRVDYGARLELLEEQGAWARVRDEAGAVGWIHRSALTEKRIVLASGDRDVDTGASGTEIALAGKGFNEEVEAEFKTRNRDIDFAWVDRMETFTVDHAAALRFLDEGGVAPATGGER